MITHFVGIKLNWSTFLASCGGEEAVMSLTIKAFLQKCGFHLRRLHALVRPEEPEFIYIGMEIPLNCSTRVVAGAEYTVSKELDWDQNDISLFTFIDEDESLDEV